MSKRPESYDTVHYTFTVSVPASTTTRDLAWPITRAILDVIEPGAGGHCLLNVPGSESWEHARLGVTVRAQEVTRP